MLLAVLALLAAPATTSSTAPAASGSYDALAKGSMGLSFFFPGGGFTAVGRGSTVGVTYLLDNNLALRLDFGLDAVVSPSGPPVSFSIGGAIRTYQIRKGPATLYFYPAVTIGRAITDVATNTATVFINLQGGVGAEYFFAEHFSVAGQLGIGLDFGNIGGPAG